MAIMKVRSGLNNFFWRFMASNLLLLFIPFSAILITYHSAADSIAEEIRTSGENTLYHFFTSMDSLLDDMVSLTLSLSRTDNIRNYSRRSLEDVRTPSIDTYYVSQSLSTLSTEYCDNMFVVYHKLDKIIGLSNSLSTELFYDAYYKDAMSYTDFQGMICAPSKNVRPTLITAGADPTNALLGVACSFSLTDNTLSTPDFTIIIIVSREQLQQLFHCAGLHNESILTVFDEKDHLAIASHPLPTEDISSSHLSKEELLATPLSHDFEVQSFSSNVLRADYLSAIPKEVFWNRLNTLRTFSLVCIFLCALLSFVVSWSLAHFNHSPITAVMDLVREKTGRLYTRQTNELAYISDILNDAFKEISLLNTQKRTQTDLIRNKFLLNALMGNADIAISRENDDIFRSNHITLLSGLFGVILYTVDLEKESSLGNWEEKENIQTLHFIFSNVFQELCAGRHRGYVVSISEQTYACIINFSESTDMESNFSDMNALAFQCKEFLQSNFRLHLSCALSEIHSGIDGIHSCYSETVSAIRYQYLYARDTSILYSRIKDRQFQYTSANNTKIKNLLIHFIKDSSVSQNAGEVIEKVIRLAGLGPDSSLESFHCFQYESLITFHMLINELNAGNLDIDKELDFALLHPTCFEDVKAFLANTLDQLRLFYQDSQKTCTLCDQVAVYLKENFADPNLSNKILGDLFQISPSYLSRLFKEQKGISLSDYLNQLRITHAKLLLETTALNMEEIAVGSGYLSSSTLIKTFKKSEGITPGAYRSMKN